MTLITTTNIEARMGGRKARFVNPIYLSIVRQLFASQNYQPPTQRAGISEKMGWPARYSESGHIFKSETPQYGRQCNTLVLNELGGVLRFKQLEEYDNI